MRRKGELSAVAIDRGWPHQVVLPARLCERDGYNEIHEFCRDLTLCSRGHALYHDGQWFHVYCFKEQADAQKFMDKIRWREVRSYRAWPRRQLGDVEKRITPAAQRAAITARRRLPSLSGNTRPDCATPQPRAFTGWLTPVFTPTSDYFG